MLLLEMSATYCNSTFSLVKKGFNKSEDEDDSGDDSNNEESVDCFHTPPSIAFFWQPQGEIWGVTKNKSF
eukprot:NODE_826_length_1427_cov_8.131350_g684_i0.p1 GENE.NODE_826_length_1427_cov_8.131350_g684_i0~~NODE_826_length_1427_cov_8.131350_g684_i0.p1  ORF type:complete len:70 (-),score=1.08 NODE_826_length_1427_cov_8.131350_g684_i0:521-730(-)